MTIDERLQTILVQCTAADVTRVANREAKLVEDLGADSLDLIEIVMSVEEEYEIAITDNDAAACRTVGDLASLIERLRAPAAA